MNWYKKSVLINRNYLDEGKPINVTCSYCNRWATNPYQENQSNQLDYKWKTVEEMDDLEKFEIQKTLAKENWTSHGICPYCVSIIKGIETLPQKENVEKIRELSLGMG